VTLHLVRHAHAGHHRDWDGPDAERPLTAKGHAQAEALTVALADAAVGRVLSSPAVRCQQTVAPVAAGHALAVEVEDRLAEGTRAADATSLLWGLAADGVDAVLCSHGDVIPIALDALARDGVDVDVRAGVPKGTAYVLTVVDGHITTARFLDPRP